MSNTKLPFKVPNTLAEDSSISGVLNTVDFELIKLILSNNINPKPLLICSGGTSSRCAADGHWTLDLRKKYNQIYFDELNNQVHLEAGIKMSKLLKKISSRNQSFPIGLSGEVGIGYILSGGISPISRSKGLAIDQLLNIKGFWGTGEILDIKKPNNSSSSKEKKIWKGLCGAAGFLGIITSVKVKTHKNSPLYISQAFISPDQLIETVNQAEEWPFSASLQWIWSNKIKVYITVDLNQSNNIKTAEELIKKLPYYYSMKSTLVSGLQELPKFNPPITKETYDHKIHSEVLSLLTKTWGSNSKELVKKLAMLIDKRPNRNCYIAAQQLGGVVSLKRETETSFIHRDAAWKPWINGAWIAGNLENREQSLLWVEEVWKEMEPLGDGIHLAQMHQHLPWHQKEIKAAFQDWLPGLQNLKSRYDPHDILPPL